MRCHNFALYLAFWKNGLFFFKFCWSTKRSISHDHSDPDIFVYKVMILWCNWSIKIKLLDGNTVRQLCGEHARQTISWLYLKLLECNFKGISSDDMFITVIIHCQKKGQQIKRNVNQSATFFLCFKKLMFSKTALTLKSISFGTLVILQGNSYTYVKNLWAPDLRQLLADYYWAFQISHET